jgi:hypothetical protein
VNEGNECGGAVNGPKRHNVVIPFGRIRTSKGEFLLKLLLHPNLVIALQGVPHPHPAAVAECEMQGQIAMWDGVSNGACDLIQWEVVYTKAPYKIVYVTNVLLMGLRYKQCLKQPFAAVNLTNMPKFLERGNAPPHDRDLSWPVVYLLDANQACAPGINGAFVVLGGDKESFVIENGPVFLQELVNGLLNRRVEMAEVKLFLQPCPMDSLVVCSHESWVNITESGRGIFLLAECLFALDSVQYHIKLMGLIWEAVIIKEDV